jgi:PhnB protein
MPKTAVKAIPDGYHTITPSLTIRQAAKAIDFYKKALGAEELGRMPGPGGTVMHAELQIGNSKFMLGEESQEMGCLGPQAIGGSATSLYIYVENVDAAWKRAIDAGGKPKMPPADMFWGDRMSSFEDPFGHKWSLAQHVKDVTPEEMKQGAQAFMEQMKAKKK